MRKKSSKAKLKREAQEALLHYMNKMGAEQKKEKQKTECLGKQMAQIEKLFGYKPYSCARS